MLFETQTAFVPSLLSFPDSLIHIKPQELNYLLSLMCQHVGYHFTHTHTHTRVPFWWWGPGRYLISWKEVVKSKLFLKQTRYSDFYWSSWWSNKKYQRNKSTHSGRAMALKILTFLYSNLVCDFAFFSCYYILKCFCIGRLILTSTVVCTAYAQFVSMNKDFWFSSKKNPEKNHWFQLLKCKEMLDFLVSSNLTAFVLVGQNKDI